MSLLEDGKNKKPLCFKLKLGLSPNWKEIVGWIAPDKYKEKPFEFVNYIIESIGEEKIDLENSILEKYFSFIRFYDGFSGMEQIWSTYHKTFVDDIEIRAKMLEARGILTLYNKYRGQFGDEIAKKLNSPIFIDPTCIGIDTSYMQYRLMDKDKLSTMPYYDIMKLLEEIYKQGFEPMYAIKTFPDALQAKFNKGKIKYNTDSYEDYGCRDELNTEVIKNDKLANIGVQLYNQRMRQHWFESLYYSLSIDITFFEGLAP
jgi:hypothetical protein